VQRYYEQLGFDFSSHPFPELAGRWMTRYTANVTALGAPTLLLADGHQSYERLRPLACTVLPSRYE